jgi:hypothetical protein
LYKVELKSIYYYCKKVIKNMKIIKILGGVLLAVYLIFVGIAGFGVSFPYFSALATLAALGSGLLILVSLLLHCKHCGCDCHCGCDKCDSDKKKHVEHVE